MLYNAMMGLRFHYENLSKHGVMPEEVEECFSDARRLIRRIGDIYWLIGKTEGGRLLQVGYRKEENKMYFVFHAMAARDYEHRQYKSRGK
jgi:uncharacterized DUF497 family protein